MPLYGDGHQRREFTYVDDVIAATLAAASAEVTAVVVNVGGGASVTMLDILELAREVTGRPVPIISAAPEAGAVAATEGDLTLAREVLGYLPAVGLREGMARQADWLSGLRGPVRMSLLPDQLGVSR